MKRYIIFLTVLMISVSTTASYSLGMNAGVIAWYSKWWPDFEESFRGEDNGITAINPEQNSPALNDQFSVESSFMTGPVLSIKLADRWSLGLVFLVSMNTKAEGTYDVFHDDPFAGWDFTTTQSNHITLRRYDFDMTIAYILHSSFSIYGGLKYLRWDGSGGNDVTTTGSVNYSFTSHTESEVTGQNIGPALGVNFNRPLAGMLFFTASGSMLTLASFSEQKISTESTEYISTSGTTNSNTSETREDSGYYLGFNITAGIGYFFESISSTLILGGRCQYLQSPGDPADIFGGVTMTAVYSF